MIENEKIITAERDADFVRRARRILAEERRRGCEPTPRRVAVLTVYGGADSFHISYPRALNELYRMLRDGEHIDPAWAEPWQLRMKHLAARVASKMADDCRRSLPDALLQVFGEGGATRFYIGIPRAIQLLRKYHVMDRPREGGESA